MAFIPIKYKNKTIRLQKAIVTPNFNDKTVLVRSHWDYVEMWLKKEKQLDALMYWK